jgi:hypothetical protein
MRLSAAIALTFLTGCASLDNTSFAPLDAKLEATGSGGAQYLVLVNTSSQTLHHYRFTGEIQNDNTLMYMGNNSFSQLPSRAPATTYVFRGFGEVLEPGKEMRFRTQSGAGVQGSIHIPVSSIQISGTCDEGPFRQGWQMNGAGQLQPVGRKANGSPTPP